MKWLPLLCLLALPAQAAPWSVSKVTDMRQAMDDITVAAANHDLVLVKMQPIDTALAKRGFENPHLRILFIGSETAVRWAEAAEPRLLNLLPLRLTLMERDGQVTVVTDDFDLWRHEFPESPGREMVRAWQEEMRLVLEEFRR